MTLNYLTLILSLIAVILLLLIWRDWDASRRMMVYGRASKWAVIKDYPNHMEAALLLERLNEDIMKFFEHLQNKYMIDVSQDKLSGAKIKWLARLQYGQYKIIDTLLKNYNYETLCENRPNTSADTSYTIDKGREMFLCLRNGRNPQELIEYPALLFVMIHELSHIANYAGWGHGEEFWTIFKFLLMEAEECGIYTPVDFSKYNINYCKLNVTYSPYYDVSLKSYYIKFIN